jgi:hypothetical protein
MSNKNLLLLGVVAVAAVGGYVLYQKHKATQPASSQTVVKTNPDQRNPGTPVNVIGEYVNKGQEVLDAFRKAFGGF